jgi:hypothetical protein
MTELTSRRTRPLAALLAALVAAASAPAAEYAPRVVSPHQADAYSMKTFAQYSRWRDLTGDARTWEVFQYLTDPRTGLFPLGQPIFEGDDVVPEYRTVRDPVKIINVYGYAFCGILGPTMAGVCQDMGSGRSRTVILPGWHHVAAETYYGGKWHYLDLDLRAAFHRGDGSLASLAEAQHDPSLWAAPQGPRFFPLDSPDEVRKGYEKTAALPYYDFHSGGHTMDYVLRQGESFTRWWQPQGGRWHHGAHHHAEPFFRQLFERPPRGPKCKHAGWTVHTYGNGRFVYRPNLTDRSSDFADGVYASANVRPAAGGLTLSEAGRGHAVFEVRSPYILVPLVGNLDTPSDDREASVVTLDAAGRVALSISLDNGLSWQDVPAPEAGQPLSFDLTRHVAGTYGYLLKLGLEGEPGRTVVRALTLTTWVQVAPAALPGLRRGTNRMEYRTGDHYGLPTRVLAIQTNGSDRADFLKYLHEPPRDFDPARKTSRAHGPFVVKVEAPPGTKIAWLSAGGNFQAQQGDDAPKTRNAIAYAVDEPRDFRPLYTADVPAGQDHWHYNVDREVKLESPARTVYLRYVGDPGVNNLRVYAHCLDDRPRPGSGVIISHTWAEGGFRKSRQFRLEKPGPYEVVTAGEPVDESIELVVPSR